MELDGTMIGDLSFGVWPLCPWVIYYNWMEIITLVTSAVRSRVPVELENSFNAEACFMHVIML